MLRMAMNIIKIPIILVALLLGGVPNVTAHVQSSPLSGIGKSVTERMPGWKLKQWKLMNNDNVVDDKVVFYDWTSGEEKVRAVLELLPWLCLTEPLPPRSVGQTYLSRFIQSLMMR
jgi:hypothetical protein